MAKEPTTKVRAMVVRGSYWKVGEDGKREEIKAGQGKDSEVEVTQSQLDAFVGVLVAVADAPAELEKVATESMQKVTPTEEAVSPSTARRPR